jgi:hypothetical protein
VRRLDLMHPLGALVTGASPAPCSWSCSP